MKGYVAIVAVTCIIIAVIGAITAIYITGRSDETNNSFVIIMAIISFVGPLVVAFGAYLKSEDATIKAGIADTKAEKMTDVAKANTTALDSQQAQLTLIHGKLDGNGKKNEEPKEEA